MGLMDLSEECVLRKCCCCKFYMDGSFRAMEAIDWFGLADDTIYIAGIH